MEFFRLIGRNPAKPVKYSSVDTRYTSLQHFMGGAEGNEINRPPMKLPIDNNEDLEIKFNSGVNRTDIPRMWGYPNVGRRLAKTKLELANDIKSWRREKGEVLYK